MDTCHTHPAEPAAGTCRSCFEPFCSHCLVYSFGRSKPPYCIDCALAAAGVRRDARREAGDTPLHR